ncbi:MAG: extracellular solute-binding protein [Chloroflexi bacterium]|nr:extracellular solute-binding protein [Chloroflexota bacterium]
MASQHGLTPLQRKSLSRRAFLLKVGAPAALMAVVAGCQTPAAAPTTAPAPAATQAPKPAATTAPAPAATTAPAATAAPAAAATTAPAAATSPFLPPAVKASAPMKITWWNWHGWHSDTINKVAAEYKKLYDQNVTLETTAYPDQVQCKAAVTAAITGGSGPDLWSTLPGGDMVSVATSGTAISYTDELFTKDPDWEKSYFPFVRGLFSVNDKVWSATPISNAYALWYNKGLFDKYSVKVPTTYDEFKAASATFLKNGVTPVSVAGGTASHPDMIFYWFVNSLGYANKMLQADLGQASWTDPQLVEAMQIYEDFGKANLVPAGVLGIKEPDAITLFASGKTAMMLEGNWARTTLAKAIAPDVKLGFVVLPAAKAGAKQTALASVGISTTINKASKNLEIAKSVARFVTTGAGRAIYCGGVGIPPSGPASSAEKDQMAKAVNDPVWPDCVDVGSKATGLRHLFTPTVEQALGQAAATILSGKGKAADVLAQVEAISKQAGKRNFTVPPWNM